MQIDSASERPTLIPAPETVTPPSPESVTPPSQFEHLRERHKQLWDELQRKKGSSEAALRKREYQTTIAEKLNNKVNPFEIPPQYTRAGMDKFFTETAESDALCDMVILKDEVRAKLALVLAEAIGKGQTIGSVTGDTDQLKFINDNAGRELGDCALMYSAAKLLQALDKAKLDCQVLAFKSAQAADETYVFFIGLTDNDIKKIQAITAAQNNEVERINVPNNDGQEMTVEIATSVGFCHSNEEALAPAIVAERERQAKDLQYAWDEVDAYLELTDVRAHIEKAKKQLAKFPLTELEYTSLSTMDLLERMLNEYQNGRVSRPVLKAMLTQFAITAIAEVKSDDAKKVHSDLYNSLRKSFEEIISNEQNEQPPIEQLVG